MNNKKTHISFVIDKSGFMEDFRLDIIKELNKKIQEIQSSENDLFFNLMFFGETVDSPLILNKPCKDLKKIRKNHYALDKKIQNIRTSKEYSLTALNDVIGTTCLNLIGLPNENDDNEFVIVILNYGEENNSNYFPTGLVKNLLKSLTKNGGWDLNFIKFNSENTSFEFEGLSGVSVFTADDLSNVFSCILDKYIGRKQ